MPAAVFGAAGLALPDGHDGAELADSQADNNATDDQLGEAKGGALENGSDEAAEAGKGDDVAAAKLVACVAAHEGAEEGANDTGGNDETLERRRARVLFVNGVDFGKGPGPVLEADQAAQSGLVVAEQDEGRRHDEGYLQHGQVVAREAEEELAHRCCLLLVLP